MKPVLFASFGAVALALAGCGSREEAVVNETATNFEDSLDTNLSAGETTDLNASDTAVNATDPALNVTDANATAETSATNVAGNAQ